MNERMRHYVYMSTIESTRQSKRLTSSYQSIDERLFSAQQKFFEQFFYIVFFAHKLVLKEVDERPLVPSPVSASTVFSSLKIVSSLSFVEKFSPIINHYLAWRVFPWLKLFGF